MLIYTYIRRMTTEITEIIEDMSSNILGRKVKINNIVLSALIDDDFEAKMTAKDELIKLAKDENMLLREKFENQTRINALEKANLEKDLEIMRLTLCIRKNHMLFFETDFQKEMYEINKIKVNAEKRMVISDNIDYYQKNLDEDQEEADYMIHHFGIELAKL